MKKFQLFNAMLLFVVALSAQTSLAKDYTRLNLPEGALTHGS